MGRGTGLKTLSHKENGKMRAMRAGPVVKSTGLKTLSHKNCSYKNCSYKNCSYKSVRVQERWKRVSGEW